MIVLIILALLFIAGVISFHCIRVKKIEKKHDEEMDKLCDELDARDKTIADYETTITKKKNKLQEESEEISKLNTKIKEYKTKLSDTIKENNATIDGLNIQLETKSNLLIKESKKNIELEKKLKEKESKRIASEGTISSKKKKITNLENEIKELEEKHKKELMVKDNAIKFWKEKCKQPDVEELKAYDLQFKEVEKRIKERK